MFSTLLAATCVLASALGAGPTVFHAAPPVRAAFVARPASYSPEAPGGPEMTAEEREFIDRINAERTERGLYALASDPMLEQAARRHSLDMSAQGYFSHMAPASSQRSPMDRYLSGLHASGQPTPAYVMVGENIYYCSCSRPGGDVLMGHQALMNSPGHRANILDARFTSIGVGIYRDSAGGFWVTEMFLRDSE